MPLPNNREGNLPRNMDTRKITSVWSSGGGVQSAAIAALIVSGKLPVPDYAAIVDTNREKSSTWEYMDAVIKPALYTVGCDLIRIDKREFATVDLYGGKNKSSLLIPAFTTRGGDIGKLPGYCSNEWKYRPLQRWLRKHGVNQAEIWMGISVDEKSRASFPKGAWTKRYPLIELRMNRGDCVALVDKMGWPTPPRSSCWMCPNHQQGELRDIKENYPKDWEKAVTFEKYIQKKDPDVWLHPDAKPLNECDISEKNESMFTQCASGLCFT